jgi:hypothetical protein
VPKEKRKKFDSKSKKLCYFLGYDDESKVCDEDKVGFQYVTDQSAIFDDPFPICSKAELDSESFILTIEQINGESIGFAL